MHLPRRRTQQQHVRLCELVIRTTPTTATSVEASTAGVSALIDAITQPSTKDTSVPSDPALAAPPMQHAPAIVLLRHDAATTPRARRPFPARPTCRAARPPTVEARQRRPLLPHMSAIVYKFPKDSWQVCILLGLFLYVDNANANTLGSRIRDAVGGPAVMDRIRQLTIAIHVAEALVMLYANIRRGASFNVTVRGKTHAQLKWVVTTLLFGGPSWGAFSSTYHAVPHTCGHARADKD